MLNNLFHFKEVEALFLYDDILPTEAIDHILTLERVLLIQDLEKVLEVCKKEGEEIRGLKEFQNNNLVIHVLYLLKELKSTTSLPSIIKFLNFEEDEELDIWVGDYLFEDIWMVLVDLGRDQLNYIEPFLYDENYNSHSKSTICISLYQLYHLDTSKRSEIEAIWNRLLDFAIKLDNRSFIPFQEFISLILSDIFEYFKEPYLSKIKRLFEQKKILLNVSGDFNEFISENYNPSAKELLSFYEFNEELNKNMLEHEDSDYDNRRIISNSTKISKNAPCPCGSGKKYKRCCL